MKLQNKNTASEKFIQNTSHIKLIQNAFFKDTVINTKFLKARIYGDNQMKKDNQENVKKNNQNISNSVNTNTLQNVNPNSWKLEISKIGLIANIAEGTSEEILNVYIGHFEETQKKNGNIGLAAHNRGYKVNYFNRLKELEVDDEIIYTYKGVSKRYNVIQTLIIEDTNWQVLENTADNRLTLITCVENEPNFRRCVQAVEKI